MESWSHNRWVSDYCLLYFYVIWTNNWANFEKGQMLNLVSLKHVKSQKHVLLSGRSVHTLFNKRSQRHMGNESTNVIQLNPVILRLIIMIIMKGNRLMFPEQLQTQAKNESELIWLNELLHQEESHQSMPPSQASPKGHSTPSRTLELFLDWEQIMK